MADETFILDIGDNVGADNSVDFGDDMDGMSNEALIFDGNEDMSGSNGFMLDGDGGMNAEQGDDFNFDGFDDLWTGDDLPPQDEDYLQSPTAKHARPAFFGRSTKAAERSALRSKFDEADAFIIQDDRGLLNSTLSRVSGTFGRRNREKGHKKVSYELDSDDDLMLNMREKGYSDRQIAEKLAKDGRIRYDQKSIATRINRIRVAQAEHMDYLLKEGYKEWCLEDDQLLMRAYDLADIEIRFEMERLRAWRFKKVSEYMRRLNKGAMFSANACRDRYTSFVNGSAVIPTDQDDNPDARRLEMEMYRREREAERAAEQAEKDKKEAKKQRIKEEARARHAKKAADTAARRDAVAQDKANRAVKRAAQASIRAQKSSEYKKKKAERHAALQAKRDADEAEKVCKERQRAKAKAYSLANTKNITANSPDPRANLSFEDLEVLCADRQLSTQARGKMELLKRLRDADQALTSTGLKALAKAKGISISGTKVQMRFQLAIAAAMGCPSYQSPNAGTTKATEDGNDEVMGDGDVGDILSDHDSKFD